MLRLLATKRALSTAAPRFKHATGLVGLEVDPLAREKLIVLYKETIAKASELNKARLKEDIIGLSKYRLSVVERLENPEEIEEEIKYGQIEELLEEAQDELELVKYLAKNELKDNPNAVFYQ